MAKGAQPSSTTTTTQNLSAEQQELLGLSMPGLREFAARTPQRYQGQTVAGFDPSQTAGQDMALAAAGVQNNVAGRAQGAIDNVFTNLWDPSNPNVQNTINASTRPIIDDLLQQALPNIRGDAVLSGNFGGSKQGIAEGQAVGRAAQAVGDTSAKITTDLYRTNIDATLKALGLAPTVQNMQLAGALTTSGVGDVRQGMNQSLINSDVAGFNFDQMAPLLQSKELISLLAGIPGGSTTAVGTQPGPSGRSTAMSALGGAASGASLGSMIMPGIGTAAGAGIGALMPFLLG